MGKTTDLDDLVGRNVRILRAYWQMRQSDVAQRMCEHGHVWTQQTVFEVEHGRRPLLLNEAHNLGGVFGTTVAKLMSEVPL